MLTRLHSKKGVQLGIGLVIGVLFGFLLQRGGATRYNVIIDQLLLWDFTVVKIMLTAAATGMVGVYLLRSLGLARLHARAGSIGSTVVGGLIFGIGFGVLGYCPGTVAGAVGNGFLDALVGGVPGAIIGSGLFAALYPKLERTILHKGEFGGVTFPQLAKVNPWVIVVPAVIVIVAVLGLIEMLEPQAIYF